GLVRHWGLRPPSPRTFPVPLCTRRCGSTNSRGSRQQAVQNCRRRPSVPALQRHLCTSRCGRVQQDSWCPTAKERRSSAKGKEAESEKQCSSSFLRLLLFDLLILQCQLDKKIFPLFVVLGRRHGILINSQPFDLLLDLFPFVQKSLHFRIAGNDRSI